MLPFVVISQSSDTKNFSFPKEGGIKEVEFTSGANNDNIEVTSSKSWINAIKTSDGKIKIGVTKNEGEKRYGYVEVKAYSTLFGIRTSSTTGTISIEQETGHASRINVSSDEITFNNNGGSKDVRIESDGYFHIVGNSPDWITITKHNNSISFNVKENQGTYRTYNYGIESGSIKKNIKISQAGGPSAEVNDVWLEHNVPRMGYQNVPYNVMIIHIDFDVENMKGKTIRVCAFFYDEDGDKMRVSNNDYRTSDGQVIVQDKATPRCESSNYSDFTLEIPYFAIKVGDNKLKIQIQDSNGDFLGESDYEYFKCY